MWSFQTSKMVLSGPEVICFFIAKPCNLYSIDLVSLLAETVIKPTKFQRRKKDTMFLLNCDFCEKGTLIGTIIFQVSQFYFKN